MKKLRKTRTQSVGELRKRVAELERQSQYDRKQYNLDLRKLRASITWLTGVANGFLQNGLPRPIEKV